MLKLVFLTSLLVTLTLALDSRCPTARNYLNSLIPLPPPPPSAPAVDGEACLVCPGAVVIANLQSIGLGFLAAPLGSPTCYPNDPTQKIGERTCVCLVTDDVNCAGAWRCV